MIFGVSFLRCFINCWISTICDLLNYDISSNVFLYWDVKFSFNWWLHSWCKMILKLKIVRTSFSFVFGGLLLLFESFNSSWSICCTALALDGAAFALFLAADFFALAIICTSTIKFNLKIFYRFPLNFKVTLSFPKIEIVTLHFDTNAYEQKLYQSIEFFRCTYFNLISLTIRSFYLRMMLKATTSFLR